jgi:exopolyphosphatase/guanosine-5'-triphosphate,3'-diphosphate pyrophosphatase
VLAPYKKVLVSKLTAIIRIADALDASHKQKSKSVSVQLTPESLHISCQSETDMSFEMWSFEHRSGLFEEVIGIRPELRIRRTL